MLALWCDSKNFIYLHVATPCSYISFVRMYQSGKSRKYKLDNFNMSFFKEERLPTFNCADVSTRFSGLQSESEVNMRTPAI